MSEGSPTPGRSARLARRPRSTTSGVLWAAASMPLLLLVMSRGPLLEVPLVWQGVAWVATACLLLAALVVGHNAVLGRSAATLAAAAGFPLAWPMLVDSPPLMLAASTSAVLSLALLWRIGAPLLSVSDAQLRAVVEGQAQGASLWAVGVWLLWELSDASASWTNVGAVSWSLACSVVFSVEWVVRCRGEYPRRARAILVVATIAIAGAALHWDDARRALSWWVLVAGISALSITRPQRAGRHKASLWESLISSPERLFVGTFLGLCAAGTVVLGLPQSAADGQSIDLVDAAFTATSAVCVTGLAVLDTGGDFSAFGQGALLVMIQVGGLGIMTFSTAALWALGKRLSLRHETTMASLISTHDRSQLFVTARHILVLTMTAELTGALVLTLAFLADGEGFPAALWRGVFTAVSAFCNAGFALQSDSLVPYQHSGLVLHTVAALIVLGSLSPLTVLAIPTLLGRSTSPVPAQVKLGLAAALTLLVLGFCMFLTVEWDASLSGLSVVERLHNAWFQSVTLRTAGFNSVSFDDLRGASISWMLLWMFIGGSPGGTAGGVKTTTVAVVALAVVQAVRGQPFLEIFGRRIPERTRTKALVVLVVALASGMVALLALQLTQRMPAGMALFEVVSALGTVGLTLGGTAELDGIGKGIILVCMFVGRVGGLSLLMFLKSRRRVATLDRPEEEIDVG